LVISSPAVGTITVNQNGSFNVPVSFTVTNSGGSAAQPNWFDHAYLSSNGVLDAASVSIGSNTRTTALAANGSYNVNQTHVTTGINPGNYTLFLRTDGKSNPTQAGWVTEGNESNKHRLWDSRDAAGLTRPRDQQSSCGDHHRRTRTTPGKHPDHVHG
jgi:hypothetical protein